MMSDPTIVPFLPALPTLLGLLALLSIGLTALCATTVLHHGPRRPGASPLPPISVLKPLKGAEADLYDNLAAFARQDYPDFELILGAADPEDPALPVAERLRVEFPALRIRIVRGAGAEVPGFNPKVDNLARLATVAHHDLLLISDADVRPNPGTLRSLAAELDLERDRTGASDQWPVGLVANLLVADGEETLGAAFETLHLAGFVSPALSAADLLAGHVCVVGKSMLLSRSALAAGGGWDGVRDVLAEDYVLGRRITEAGYRVVLCRRPVVAVHRHRPLRAFLARHLRWSQMRARIAPLAYLGEPLLNPTPWVLAWALATAVKGAFVPAAFGTAAGLVGKAALDAALVHRLRGTPPALRHLLLAPVKDLAVLGLWILGACRRTIVWRDNRLLIRRGSRLEPLDAELRRGQAFEDPLSDTLSPSGRAV